MSNLAVFETDEGITISFGELLHFISKDEPFYNIAQKSRKKNDYIPFYVELAKREGLGEEFKNKLVEQLKQLEEEE